jgi:hypothetical protein
MATIRDLERGMRLAETIPDEIGHEVEVLCLLLADSVADLVVSLSMFEQAQVEWAKVAAADFDLEESNREAERYRKRAAQLEAESAIKWGDSDYFERTVAIHEQARRDVLREEWAKSGGPESYKFRERFIHARSFVNALAVLQRILVAICSCGFEPEVAAKLEQARDAFTEAIPGLKDVRDSVAHVDERWRGASRGRKIAAEPVTNDFINAPGGGVMFIEGLIGNRFGGTTADGTHAEVEVSDATTEVARAAVQAVFDALPWRPGPRMYYPSN